MKTLTLAECMNIYGGCYIYILSIYNRLLLNILYVINQKYGLNL